VCGSSPKVDTSVQDQMLADSQEARRKEEGRQARIKDGTGQINDIFSGFGEEYYDDFRDTYLDYYQPQIDRQYGDAQDQLTYALTRAGTLKSTMAAEKFAKLGENYQDQRASTAANALSATSTLRGKTNSERSGLISLLNATGDADMAANEALSRSQQLFEEVPNVSPLGPIFAGVSSGIGNNYYNQQQQSLYDQYLRSANGGVGGGNTTVIGNV
jgi:hypothetical protein